MRVSVELHGNEVILKAAIQHFNEISQRVVGSGFDVEVHVISCCHILPASIV